MFGNIGKMVAAVAQVVIAALLTITDPGNIDGAGALVTSGEVVWLAQATAGIVLVAVVPNLTGGVAKYTKLILHGVLAVLALGLSWYLDGFQAYDGFMLLSTFLTGAGVWGAKAPQWSGPPIIEGAADHKAAA